MNWEERLSPVRCWEREFLYLFFLLFFFFFEVMWSFAAAPGSLPLPKETPLSGYLLGNPVPAERSWMEPRRSTVPDGDGTEPHVPRDHAELFPPPVPAS